MTRCNETKNRLNYFYKRYPFDIDICDENATPNSSILCAGH